MVEDSEGKETQSLQEEATDVVDKKRHFIRREVDKARRHAGGEFQSRTDKEYESNPELNEKTVKFANASLSELAVEIGDIETALQRKGLGKEREKKLQEELDKKKQIEDHLLTAVYAAVKKSGDAGWMKTDTGEEKITQEDVDVFLASSVELMIEHKIGSKEVSGEKGKLKEKVRGTVSNKAKEVQEKVFGNLRANRSKVRDVRRMASGDVEIHALEDWEGLLELREQYNANFGDIPEGRSELYEETLAKVWRPVWRTVKGIPATTIRSATGYEPEFGKVPMPESKISKPFMRMRGRELAWGEVEMQRVRDRLEKKVTERLEKKEEKEAEQVEKDVEGEGTGEAVTEVEVVEGEEKELSEDEQTVLEEEGETGAMTFQELLKDLLERAEKEDIDVQQELTDVGVFQEVVDERRKKPESEAQAETKLTEAEGQKIESEAQKKILKVAAEAYQVGIEEAVNMEDFVSQLAEKNGITDTKVIQELTKGFASLGKDKYSIEDWKKLKELKKEKRDARVILFIMEFLGMIADKAIESTKQAATEGVSATSQ
jgi:hypothetical protein